MFNINNYLYKKQREKKTYTDVLKFEVCCGGWDWGLTPMELDSLQYLLPIINHKNKETHNSSYEALQSLETKEHRMVLSHRKFRESRKYCPVLKGKESMENIFLFPYNCLLLQPPCNDSGNFHNHP